MMSWSGLSLTCVKDAYEMGISELQRQHHVGSQALITDRSMSPKDLLTERSEDQARTSKILFPRFGGISLFVQNDLTGKDPLPKS